MTSFETPISEFMYPPPPRLMQARIDQSSLYCSRAILPTLGCYVIGMATKC